MDIDTVLEKWYSAKEKIKLLENKIEKYKKSIEKELSRKRTDSISTKHYTIEKRSNVRTYISKATIPDNVWHQYSTRCNYDSYHLKERRK